MQLVDLELKIENLRAAIEALRGSNANRTEIDRALSELARVKAERLRLMLRQVNFHTERGPHQPIPASAPKDREAIAGRLGDAD